MFQNNDLIHNQETGMSPIRVVMLLFVCVPYAQYSKRGSRIWAFP